MQTAQVNILYLIDSYLGPVAGTERQLIQLVRNLDKERFIPSLAVLRETEYIKERSDIPCPVIVLEINKLFSPYAVLRLAKLSKFIRQRDFKIVHIFFNDSAVVAPLFCKWGGAKVVSSRRDMGFWYTTAILFALRASNRFVDVILSNSLAVKANVQRYERVGIDRTEVIYNGHAEEQFQCAPSATFRVSLGIEADAPIIGMVANLYPIKRQGDLIKAFAIVRKRFSDAHLVLVGDGADKRHLLALGHKLGIGEYIHLIGRVSEAVPIIKHFSICVLCSESEGLSNAIIEYMLCGKPTVCTNTGGNPELIRNGYNGFLIEVGDIQSLAEHLIKLLSDPPLMQRMAANATIYAASKFSLHRMVTRHMDLYSKLLANNG